MGSRVAVVVLFAALAGCTAIQAEINVVSAEQSVARAREANAPDLAPYEYTMAIRYLEKSKEEAGYASYRASVELSKKAADWADQSIIVIQKGGRQLTIEAAGSDITDSAVPPTTPPATPPPVAPPPAGATPPATPPTTPPPGDGPIDIDDDGSTP